MLETIEFDRIAGVHVSRNRQTSHTGNGIMHDLHDCVFVCATIP